MAHRKKVPSSRQSQRQQDCESLIREVSARPGIRELMKVYGAWKQADRSLEPHRAISRNQVVTTTTNHTAFFHRWTPPATFALVLSLVAGPLCGQTMLGVRGGASIASLSQNDDSEPESRTGVAVGMLLETPISQALALRAEGAYVEKGASSDDATLELDYVELSALLKTGTSGTPSIHVFGGPAVGINTSCRVSAHVIADIVDRLFGSSGIEEGPCDALSEEIVVETFDFGAKVGVEGAMRAGESTRLSLELAYTLGLNDLDGGAKNRTFLIQVGAAIPVG